MKLECPYCWQHYEIEKSDLDRELKCINCEQTFWVRDALLVKNQSSSHRILYWVIGFMGAAIVLLAALLIWFLVNSRNSQMQPAKPAPVVKAPAVQAPVVKAPVVKAPVVKAPAVKAPAVKAPAVKAPAVQVPAVKAPAVKAPAVKAPAVKAPAVQAPAVIAPAVKAPAVKAPAVQAPAVKAPAVIAPAGQAAAVQAPAVKAPAVQAPAVQAPAVQAPAVQAPAVQAPAVKAPAVTAPAAANLQTVIAPLYRMLKDIRTELDRNVKTQQQQSLAIQQLSVRLERVERNQPATAVDNARPGAAAAAGKAVPGNPAVKSAKELSDLRGEINRLNYRLSSQESKSGKSDLSALNRRLDKLEAQLNAIRRSR